MILDPIAYENLILFYKGYMWQFFSSASFRKNRLMFILIYLKDIDFDIPSSIINARPSFNEYF